MTTLDQPRHIYHATCSWAGSTAVGYEAYSRSHVGQAPPARTAVELSSDVPFRGTAERLNPEQLLVLAAVSCQLLSFLAIAARARVDVRRYTDDADATMAEDGTGGGRFTRITLRPRITVVADVAASGEATPEAELRGAEKRLRRLADLAHQQCYVSSSLTCPVIVEPVFEFVTSYAFGDSELAARRLALLAEVFEPSSRGFLAQHAPRGCELAVDLGCGPGNTTSLLATTTGAARAVGLDASASFLATARLAVPASVQFAQHDLRHAPWPEPARGADVAYARFLLAHLNDVATVVSVWRGELGPAGLLLLEETEAIDTDQPALAEYLRYAERLLAARGTTMYAGARLDAAVCDPAGASGATVHDSTARLPVPVPQAAEMFALNLAVWRSDPLLRDEQGDLDRLAAELDRLRDSDGPGTITWTIRQVVLRGTASPTSCPDQEPD